MPEESGTARATILERIRGANREAGFGEDTDGLPADYAAVPRAYQQAAGMERKEILEAFTERLIEYDARVREATEATVAAAISEALAGKSVIVSSGFPQAWVPEGVNWRAEADASTDEMNAVEAALVACEVAIAHTGTIILRDSRRLSLLPDSLVCVVREEQVVETVPEAFARLQPFAAEALTFISGPSATADIEMTRIRGVHGPRFLDVVVTRDR